MYGTGTKKMLMMLILEVLRKYSDEEHHLTQRRIMKYLKDDYDMDCDRRSVKANVLALIELGYDIDMEDGYVLLSREFDEAELRMLIDSVLFSKSLSKKQAKDLIEKIESFGSKYFKSKVSHVVSSAGIIRTDNKQMLYTVGALNDAIDAKKKVTFRYGKYDVDLKLHDKGHDYIVNPFQMVTANGYYYLLGNIDDYNNLAYFRVDKILDIKTLDAGRKNKKDVPELIGFDLPKHMAEHIYMLSGETGLVRFKTNRRMLDTVIDWFGRNVGVILLEGDEIEIRVHCNYKAMKYWALQYGSLVEVISPADLRNQIGQEARSIAKKYDS